MKPLITLLFLLIAGVGYGQDTIYFYKDGATCNALTEKYGSPDEVLGDTIKIITNWQNYIFDEYIWLKVPNNYNADYVLIKIKRCP